MVLEPRAHALSQTGEPLLGAHRIGLQQPPKGTGPKLADESRLKAGPLRVRAALARARPASRGRTVRAPSPIHGQDRCRGLAQDLGEHVAQLQQQRLAILGRVLLHMPKDPDHPATAKEARQEAEARKLHDPLRMRDHEEQVRTLHQLTRELSMAGRVAVVVGPIHQHDGSLERLERRHAPHLCPRAQRLAQELARQAGNGLGCNEATGGRPQGAHLGSGLADERVEQGGLPRAGGSHQRHHPCGARALRGPLQVRKERARLLGLARLEPRLEGVEGPAALREPLSQLPAPVRGLSHLRSSSRTVSMEA